MTLRNALLEFDSTNSEGKKDGSLRVGVSTDNDLMRASFEVSSEQQYPRVMLSRVEVERLWSSLGFVLGKLP